MRASSVLQIPPPTTAPPDGRATASDHPVINLDLHSVAVDDAGLNASKSGGISLHDQEATVVESPYKNRTPAPTLGDALPKQDLATGRSRRQEMGGMSHSSRGANNQPKAAVKRPKRVNQFKQNKMSHEEIIAFLFELSSSSVGLNRRMEPTDLDSTQGLDSFLSAIIEINEKNVQKKDQKLIDNLHLSTGTRTNFCLEVLNFIIKQQSKETIFIDAVEFFQESLEHMVDVENENSANKRLVEELQQSKTELTMMRFDLQNKLKETSNALLKLRQKEYEQSLSYAETKNHLQAKTAECESLHYRLKHLGVGAEGAGQGGEGGQMVPDAVARAAADGDLPGQPSDD